LGAVLLLAAVCSADPLPGSTTLATGTEVEALPPSGKVRSETAPPKAVFGMIWIDTTTDREYIFDGNGWVPHDQSVDAPAPGK
jgi:hypothetical protein